MILLDENLALLHTEHSTYVFYVRESGHLEHLYYGPRLVGMTESRSLIEAMRQKVSFLPGNTIAYSTEFGTLGMEVIAQEISSLGKGDVRQPFIELESSDGYRSSDFKFKGWQVVKKQEIKGQKEAYGVLPYSICSENMTDTLEIVLEDSEQMAELIIRYSVFEKTDQIVRSASLENKGHESLKVRRLMSLQLDLSHSEWDITHFSGAWAREMQRTTKPHPGGIWQNGSLAGVSSSRSNPFFMLSEPGTKEKFGHCYGFNLLYSGNHYGTVQAGTHGGLRVLVGVNPEDLSQTLLPSQVLEVPEAIMSFSAQGFEQLSQQMHAFIQDHIVRGRWQYKERPILINSWEAHYFKFDERKLLHLAKTAQSVGIELFVLDDGWFGNRNDDQRGLGDWTVNLKKLPGGLSRLSEKIHDMGMTFGIWVEPEMTNEDSDLYRSHPDWVLKHPRADHSLGRNQMILDLTKGEVQDYLVSAMTQVFSSARIDYVKWDMNRIFTDWFSQGAKNQEALVYKYVLGLYSVLDRLTTAFPHILWEGCASGGNRFDLGMLCYMPQIWASDNTDAISRLEIQNGYSYGYPLSVMGSHVSDCPNHQTLRQVPLDTRQAVASFGLLGYEINLNDLSDSALKEISAHIAHYQLWRRVFQFGRFYRLEAGDMTGMSDGLGWTVVSADQRLAVVGVFQRLSMANQMNLRLKIKGLKPEGIYRLSNLPKDLDIKQFGDLINTASPVHIANGSLTQHLVSKVYKLKGETESHLVSGSILCQSGIALKQGFGGVGFNEDVRLMQDFSSRLYFAVLEP